MIDHDALLACDPGIRRLVSLINELGWETTDSGDGKTKFTQEEAMVCAVGYAHVIAVAVSELDAPTLHTMLLPYLTDDGRARLDVQYSSSTLQGFRVLEVAGVNDEDLVR